jgi:hypothetical protein
MWIGVSRAGYSLTEELPIFLLIFRACGGSGVYLLEVCLSVSKLVMGKSRLKRL